jgi:hypothetical protein
LRIDGRRLSQIVDHRALSAVLCLQDVDGNRGRQITAVTQHPIEELRRSSSEVAKCQNAVQAGPRIIEAGEKPGTSFTELQRPKYQRVVFMVDEPRRTEEANSRSDARNGYLLITHNPVHLFDVQTMLLDPAFYDGGKPYFATNLAGADETSLMLLSSEMSEDKPEFIENSLAIVGSALVVERRAD